MRNKSLSSSSATSYIPASLSPSLHHLRNHHYFNYDIRPPHHRHFIHPCHPQYHSDYHRHHVIIHLVISLILLILLAIITVLSSPRYRDHSHYLISLIDTLFVLILVNFTIIIILIAILINRHQHNGSS